jgi:hypothetical protein
VSALDPGPEIDRVQWSPFLGWLRRSSVRALVVHERGLRVERGNGTTFAPWSEVRSVIAGTADMVLKATGEVRQSLATFELDLGGERIKMPRALALAAGQRIADAIVARAGLEWFQGEIGGRKTMPLAVPPAQAANLRASFAALRK